MPSEAFMRLYSYGTELYRAGKGTKPISFAEMAEIHSLIATCQKSANTDQEKSIVIRAQEFWNACLRKWPDSNLKEFETNPGMPEQEAKISQPGPREKASLFTALIRLTRSMGSGRGLSDMTPEDFGQMMKLIDQCSSIATTRQEKTIIEGAKETHTNQFARWQELRQENRSEMQENPAPESDFDSKLTRDDRFLLAAHHQIILKKMQEEEKG
ncbi:MAG: hypothetical protein HYT62_03815 [Candidatus Yanofskybacteria bacterium]|nr:hypothetical protein [Candidatus Yanofskybacteria bacterium]